MGRRNKKLEALAIELYTPNKLDEGNLKAFGLTVDDFGQDIIEIWQENYESYLVFTCMSTQWRIGMNGATGLDYSALGEIWRRLKIPIANRDDVFQDIRIMENKALETMRKNSK